MPAAVKVGIFATIILVLLGALILKIEDIRLFGGPQAELRAAFDTVAGLDDKATVRIAGVRVGRVDGIELDGERAVVRMVLEREVPLTEGTVARIANMGLLGDKYVVLEPGPAGAPPLPPGTIIAGSSPPTFDEAMAKFSAIGDSIQSVTGSLGEGGFAGGSIDRLIGNFEAVSAEIRLLVESNRDEVEAISANLALTSAVLARDLPRLTARAEEMLAGLGGAARQLEAALGDGRPDVQASLGNLRRLTEEARTSVDNLNQVTGRLARGEGTVGKILTTDELHDEMVSTLQAVETGVETLSGTLGGIQKIQLQLGLESFYLAELEESRSTFQLDLDPQSGRLYRVGVVDTPLGTIATKTDTVTVTDPDGRSETTVIETTTREDDISFSALFGFDGPRDARLWAGMIESSGGVQVDYPLLDRRLWLSLEAFDFDRQGDLDPHLRLGGRWRFHPNMYLVGGYDDILVDDRRSIFLGGGIRWRDDNLKYLLGSIPSF